MRLFEPITVKGMTLKNRIVMAPMNYIYGIQTRQGREFHAERARGGAGTITVHATPVDAMISNGVWRHPYGVTSFLEALSLLVDAVHEAGAKVGIQLYYANRFPGGTWVGDTQGELVGPSAKSGKDEIRPELRGEMRELTIPEIKLITERYGRASLNAKEAGFDFVEVHGAHVALPRRFFSLIENHRIDRYGGDMAGRMRFSLEVVGAIRREVGTDYPVFFRFAAEENLPNGITLQESVPYAVELEKAGVDVLSVTTGLPGPPPYPDIGPSAYYPMGTFVYLAEAIKKNVGVPVICVGRIHAPDVAESVLSEGKADLIAMGRQLVADPYWPTKVAAGDLDDIRPCLSCSKCHWLAQQRDPEGKPAKCVVNPRMGREMEALPGRAKIKKRVFVVGGGPGGMEAARSAADRGHRVTLFEKRETLGGQMVTAAAPPNKGEIESFRRYLVSSP